MVFLRDREMGQADLYRVDGEDLGRALVVAPVVGI